MFKRQIFSLQAEYARLRQAVEKITMPTIRYEEGKREAIPAGNPWEGMSPAKDRPYCIAKTGFALPE
jgi:hypothetical protein